MDMAHGIVLYVLYRKVKKYSIFEKILVYS